MEEIKKYVVTCRKCGENGISVRENGIWFCQNCGIEMKLEELEDRIRANENLLAKLEFVGYSER